jgi:potassium efflux system protein
MANPTLSPHRMRDARVKGRLPCTLASPRRNGSPAGPRQRAKQQWQLAAMALCLVALIPVADCHAQATDAKSANALRPRSQQDGIVSDDPAETEGREAITKLVARLKAKLNDLKNQDVPDEIKEKVSKFYLSAIGEWETALKHADDANKFRSQVSEAPNSLFEQQQTREQELKLKPRGVPPDASPDELDLFVEERASSLEDYGREKQELDAQSQDRSKEIEDRIKEYENKLDEIKLQLDQKPDGELSVVTEARRGLLAARNRRAENAIDALQREEDAYKAEIVLRTVMVDIIANRVDRLKKEIEQLKQAANDRRRTEAERRLDEARDSQRIHSEKSNQIIVALADNNVAIAEQGLILSRRSSQAKQHDQLILDNAERLTKGRARLQQRDHHRDAALALLMGRERASIPDIYFHRREIRKRQEESTRIYGTLVEIREERARLAVLNDVVDSYSEGDPDSKHIVHELLRQQRDLLDVNLKLANDLFLQLDDTSVAEQNLIDQAISYRTYIDERILWLKSDQMMGYNDVVSTRGALIWLVRPDHWRSLFASLRKDAQTLPITWSAFAVLFVASLVVRPRLRRTLGDLGTEASRGNCVRIAPTAQATMITLLLAGIIPIALAAGGWRCLATIDIENGEFIRSIGGGLFSAAAVLWLLDALRTCCRPKGLGSSHFFWASLVNSSVRNTLKWYLLPATVLAGVLTTVQLQSDAAYRSGLGRLAFLLLMLTTIGAIRQLLHPRFGIFSDYLERYDRGWMAKLSWFWYPLSLAIPAALLLLAASGYFYTAWQLSARLYGTILIVLLIQLTGSLLFRWVLINRRRLAVQRYRERIARETSGDATGESQRKTDVDLVEINIQTQRLIRSGLLCVAAVMIAGIWADELPALRLLDDIHLWYVAGSVAGELMAISIADVLVALLVIIMTVIAGRNLPGLLEIAILQQLPIDSSIRYAITTLGRYAITIAGIIATASLLGITWENVRWLVAAMGVGLGFGLQEVVANFVCGVILMFERPIRVGDVITLGDVTGKVSRIRIRATTLTDWDGKELVVPNKDLITGRLLNWTLTDSRNRVVIEVGIAYGANVAKARQIILAVAENHPHILSDPSPSVTFQSFGDSALLLVLRAFLGSLDNRLGTIHTLHEQVHEQLNVADIEIAFPHRDLNIRSLPPIILAPPSGEPAS